MGSFYEPVYKENREAENTDSARRGITTSVTNLISKCATFYDTKII
jgi:hypothetical protein